MTGVDTILQKTQEDLGRIKKTSYYQRKQKAETPTPGEEVKPIVAAGTPSQSTGAKVKWIGFDSEANRNQEEGDATEEATAVASAEVESELNEEQEEEEEEDNDDDLFNTEYVDVVTSGELKLAYVPDSPTLDVADGDDPFDTSAVEKTVGPLPVIKKKKALVSIGAAAEVLTKVNAADPITNRRNRAVQPPTEIQLLCCFDAEDNQQQTKLTPASTSVSQAATPCVSHTPTPTPRKEVAATPDIKDILAEFDVIPDSVNNDEIVEELIEKPAPLPPPPPQPKAQLPLDEEDIEFEALAYESLAKHPHLADPVDEDDPFDTSSVDHVLNKKEPTPIDNAAVSAKKGGVPPPARPSAPPRPTRPSAPPARAPVAEKTPVVPLQAQDSFDALFLNDDSSPTASAVTAVIAPAPIQVDELESAADEDDPFDTSAVDRVIQSSTAVTVKEEAVPTAGSFAVPDFDDQTEEDDPFDTSAVEKILN